MSSFNPSEPQVEADAAPEGRTKSETRPRSKKLCPYYRSARGCNKGDACHMSHASPKTTRNATQSDSSPPVDAADGSSSSTPAEPSASQPKKRFNRKPNQYGKGRGKLSPEQVKEQALAQSAAAKAENAKKVTVVSEDDEQSWILERDFLSTHSKTMGLVLAYSRQKAETGVKDPIKTTRGLLRFGENLENLQLDDVKADDFDIFLAGLRASKEVEFNLEELQVILTLASDWGFEDLGNRTIREIEKHHPSPIDRAVLARRCKIAKWIRGALLSLTILPEPLNATEIQILGTTTAALIWRAREEILIHRLQALTTAENTAARVKCTGQSCKQTIREALVRVLEKPGTAGKSESDLAVLAENEFKAPESNKESLCEGCKSDTGLKNAINELVGDLKLARIIMEVQLGKEGGRWLEPV